MRALLAFRGEGGLGGQGFERPHVEVLDLKQTGREHHVAM